MTINELKEDKKNHCLIVRVTSDQKQWDKIQDKLVKKYALIGTLRGFRRGHIPEDIASTYVKSHNMYADGMREIIEFTFNELLETKRIMDKNIIEDSPYITVLKVSADNVQIEYKFDHAPRVTVGDYEHIIHDYKKPEVTEIEIENQLKMLVNKYKVILQSTKADVVANESLVKIDYEGFIDKKPFPGSKANNYCLTIGSGDFVPGFEESLIGHKLNETVEFTIKMPDDYYLPECAGKKATYSVKIKEIKNEVKISLEPEFIKKIGIQGVENIDQLRQYFKNLVLAEKNQQEDERVKTIITKFLTETTKLDYIPKNVMDSRVFYITNQYKQLAKSKNLSLEGFIKKDQAIGSMKVFNQLVIKQAKKNAQLMFAMDKLIEKYKISATEQEIQAVLKQWSIKYNASIEQLKAQMGGNFDEIEGNIIQQKLYDRLIKVNEENSDLETKKPAKKGKKKYIKMGKK